MFFKKKKKAPEPAVEEPKAPQPTDSAASEPIRSEAPSAAAPTDGGTVEPGGHVVFCGDGAQGPMKDLVIGAMKKVYDPEIPIDVYELGLIYKVDISASSDVSVDMTLTSPNCPSAEQIPGDIEKQIRAVDGIADVKVEVIWDPPWYKDKMSEAAMLELGFE